MWCGHCYWWHPRSRQERSVFTTWRQWLQASDHHHQRPDTAPQKQATSKLELQKSQLGCFREAVDRKTALLELSETNISQCFSYQQGCTWRSRDDYQPFWTPELDNLHKALGQAREKMESSPTNANVEAHSKAKVQYTRARTQASGNSWHETDSITEYGKSFWN